MSALLAEAPMVSMPTVRRSGRIAMVSPALAPGFVTSATGSMSSSCQVVTPAATRLRLTQRGVVVAGMAFVSLMSLMFGTVVTQFLAISPV